MNVTEAEPFQTADTYLSAWVNHILGRMSQLVLMTSHSFLEIEGVWGEGGCYQVMLFEVSRRDTSIHGGFTVKQLSMQMKLVKSTVASDVPFLPALKKKKTCSWNMLSDHHLFQLSLFSCPLTNAEHCKVTRNPLALYLCESCSRGEHVLALNLHSRSSCGAQRDCVFNRGRPAGCLIN